MLPYLMRLYTYKSLAATFTRMIAADLWRLSTLAFMLILEMVVYIIQGPGRALMFTSIDVMRYGVKALFHHDLRSSLGLNAVSRTAYLDGPATGSCIAANPPCPGKVALGIRPASASGLQPHWAPICTALRWYIVLQEGSSPPRSHCCHGVTGDVRKRFGRRALVQAQARCGKECGGRRRNRGGYRTRGRGTGGCGRGYGGRRRRSRTR